MSAELTGSACSADGSVKVTVGPGGTIRALELTVVPLDEDAEHVAHTVSGTAQTGRRTGHALSAHLGGLTEGSLRLLGFVRDEALVERAGPTPVTWHDL